MAAHRKLDRRRDDLCAVELRKRASKMCCRRPVFSSQAHSTANPVIHCAASIPTAIYGAANGLPLRHRRRDVQTNVNTSENQCLRGNYTATRDCFYRATADSVSVASVTRVALPPALAALFRAENLPSPRRENTSRASAPCDSLCPRAWPEPGHMSVAHPPDVVKVFACKIRPLVSHSLALFRQRLVARLG